MEHEIKEIKVKHLHLHQSVKTEVAPWMKGETFSNIYNQVTLCLIQPSLDDMSLVSSYECTQHANSIVLLLIVTLLINAKAIFSEGPLL